MKNAIILHGRPSKEAYYSDKYPSASNAYWLPWLQKQLTMRDIPAQTPEVPNAYKRHYPTWCKEFERYDVTPETILVGHSLGGGFIVRWLSEHKDVKVGRVVLVAPWLDPDNVDQDNFFDFTIDPNLASRTAGLTIFNSDNDADDIHRSITTIQAAAKGIAIRDFHNYGHFTFGSMGTVEFPELVQELMRG
jgi:predicted alpha/beta hydrolase family esterase